MENHYETLHVANFAEIEVVKAAYKAVTKLYHPDINKEVDSSVMVKINLAYEVLGDPAKKERYDRELRTALNKKTEAHCSSPKTEPKEESKTTQNTNTERRECSKHGKIMSAFINGAKFVGESILNSMQEAKKEYENAYYQGCEFTDDRLVRMYLKSVGAKRNGYAQALIDRGLLYREGDKLVPSYTFKMIARR